MLEDDVTARESPSKLALATIPLHIFLIAHAASRVCPTLLRSLMVHLLTTRVAAADSLLSLALRLFLLPFLRIFLAHNMIFVADINNHIAIAFI